MYIDLSEWSFQILAFFLYIVTTLIYYLVIVEYIGGGGDHYVEFCYLPKIKWICVKSVSKRFFKCGTVTLGMIGVLKTLKTKSKMF